MKLKFVIIATVIVLLVLAVPLGSGLAQTPTPVKVSELTPQATVTPGDYLYVVSGATPVSRKANVEAVVRGGLYTELDVTDTDITANVPLISGSTFTLESVVFSGPVTFGSQATCIEDTEIAHGLGITPTTVLLTPYSAITSTVYVKATDATTITIGIVGAVGEADLYWLAGK